MYNITNRKGEVLTMRDGTPFVYTVEWTARLGAKYLRGRTPKPERPLRVVRAS